MWSPEKESNLWIQLVFWFVVEDVLDWVHDRGENYSPFNEPGANGVTAFRRPTFVKKIRHRVPRSAATPFETLFIMYSVLPPFVTAELGE